MKSDPFLSIIVPTYQRAQQIQRLLPWFFAQKIDRNRSELIIVDDGSSDQTWSILQSAAEAQAWLRPLRQKNAGQAAARQLGVDASRGSVLLFVDDDMEPASPDFFEQHRQFHAKQDAAVAFGAILPPSGDPTRPAFEYFYEKSIRRMYQDFTSGRQTPSGKHFFSANVSLSKELFLSVGGFDPSYRHAEDRELGLRLEHKARAHFAYLPAAGAYHHSPTGLYASFVRRAELYGSYDLKMAKLYPERSDLHPSAVLTHPSPIKRGLAQLVWRWPQIPPFFNEALARSAESFHRMNLTPIAQLICSVLFTINYVRGFRLESQKIETLKKDAPHAA